MPYSSPSPKPPACTGLKRISIQLSYQCAHMDFISSPFDYRSLALSFQLKDHPPLLLRAPASHPVKGSMGGTKFHFNSAVTCTTEITYDSLQEVLSPEKSLTVLLLRQPLPSSHIPNPAPVLVGTAFLSLRSLLVPRSASHSTGIWGKVSKNLSFKTHLGAFCATGLFTVSCVSSSLLLRPVIGPSAVPRPVGRAAGSKMGFVFDITIDWVDWSDNWKGSWPIVAVKFKGAKPTIFNPHRLNNLTQKEGCRIHATQQVALDMRASECEDLLSECVVMVLQEQSEIQKGSMPLSANHLMLLANGATDLELSLEKAQARGDLGDDGFQGIWGERNFNQVVVDGKGKARGRVKGRVKAYCGGVAFTAERTEDKWDMETDGGEADDWVGRLKGTVKGGAMGLRESWTLRESHESTRARTRSDGERMATTPGLRVGIRDNDAGSAVMKSTTFSPGFVGHDWGGPYMKKMSPMQGAEPMSIGGGGYGDGGMDTEEIGGQGNTSNFANDSDAGFRVKDDLEEDVVGERRVGGYDLKDEGDIFYRVSASMTILGDVESIPSKSAVRKKFEQDFKSDISNALGGAKVEIAGLRKGSIVVDFYVTECRSVKIHEVMGVLKSQLMNPSSILLDGKVTSTAVSMVGEVERCRAEGGDVRKSGLFFMGTPEDGTAVVPGGSGGRDREFVRGVGATSEKLPVGIRGGAGVCKGEFGERDAPAVLYYYPGGEGVHVAEEIEVKGRQQDWIEGKRALGKGEGDFEEDQVKDGISERLSPALSKTSFTSIGPRSSPQGSVASTSNIYIGEGVGQGEKQLRGVGRDLKEGESVLAALLGEVKDTGGSSLLARLFVELLAVQKQAVVRRSLDVGRGGRTGDEGGAAEPAWSPDEEDKIRQWFSLNARNGTVGTQEFVAFVKTIDERFKNEHISAGAEDRIDWDSILEWIGL